MGVIAPCCLIKACADNLVTVETSAGPYLSCFKEAGQETNSGQFIVNPMPTMSMATRIVCLAARGWEDYVNRNGNAFVIGIMRTTVRTTVSTHS